VAFSDRISHFLVKSQGEGMRIGEIDPRCVAETNKPPQLTAEQAVAHIWTPDAKTWETIKKHSVVQPALMTIMGSPDGNFKNGISRGQVRIQTSPDPVGAPS
jgi:hypothetical protein